MDIVDKITQVPLNGETPATDVVIKDIAIYTYTDGELVDYVLEDTAEFIKQAQENHNTMIQQAGDKIKEQREAKIQQDISRTAQSGDVVEFKYEFALEDGTIIDSTLEEEFGGQVQIDGQNPLPGLNSVLTGMKIGETKSGTLQPTDAYGPETIEVPREQMKDFEDAGLTLEAGNTLPVQGGEIEILSVTDSIVTIKNPHPAAGKNLNYTVKVVYFVN
ncbi:MAG: FKBP-type peptidyl-prolyl cis-trans isomerase [Patescibacteria group bacterium]